MYYDLSTVCVIRITLLALHVCVVTQCSHLCGSYRVTVLSGQCSAVSLELVLLNQHSLLSCVFKLFSHVDYVLSVDYLNGIVH